MSTPIGAWYAQGEDSYPHDNWTEDHQGQTSFNYALTSRWAEAKLKAKRKGVITAASSLRGAHMAREGKSQHICQQCSFQSAKWLGRCPRCGQWNTLVEEIKAVLDEEQLRKFEKIKLPEVKMPEVGGGRRGGRMGVGGSRGGGFPPF